MLPLSICLAAVLTLGAQTQQGYVKTPGRLGNNGQVIAGKRLSGVTVQVKGRSAVLSNANGAFSFPIPANKFSIQSVKKQGYILTDPEATARQYSYTTTPLVLVMETPSQQTDNKLANERKIRRTLQRQLQEKEDEIEALKAQNKITQEEYQKKLQQLYAEQENNEKLISEMAERYSQIDFDQLDEFNLLISDCILNGRLTEADSLLRSKGDINTRIAQLNQHHDANIEVRENLEKSEEMEQKTRDDIAQDCYSFYRKFFLEHQNDSAAHYLELRAALDTTNLKWQEQAGFFIVGLLQNYSLALIYLQRGLRQALTQEGEESEWAVTFYNEIGLVYDEQRDYPKALEYYQKALDIRERVFGHGHPDLAKAYDRIGLLCECYGDYAKALEYHQKAIEIIEQAFGMDNPVIVSSYYNRIGTVYNHKGDYAKALEYHQKALDILGTNCTFAVANTYCRMGDVYCHQGNNTKALEYYQMALGIKVRVLSPDDSSIAYTHEDIGMVYYNIGNYGKAFEHFKSAFDIFERELGSSMAQSLSIHSRIAECRYELALETGDLNQFNLDHCYIATIDEGDTPAAQQGMSGEYILLEFADWNQHSQTSLFDKNIEMRGKPKDIVVLKDGVITEHHFVNSIGAHLNVKQITKEERERINQLYEQWKREKKN